MDDDEDRPLSPQTKDRRPQRAILLINKAPCLFAPMLHRLLGKQILSHRRSRSAIVQVSAMSKPTPDTFRYFFSEPAHVESKCIFCKIADGRIKPGNPRDPAQLIFENDNLVAFDDINPGSKRHLLVIPKKHLKNCWDLKPKLLNEMDDLANKMLELYNPEGAQSRKFFIRPPWNSVYHVHLHIMIGELTDPIWHLRKIGFQSPLFHITPDQLRKENALKEEGGPTPPN